MLLCTISGVKFSDILAETTEKMAHAIEEAD
jgi:hypothetical protein